MPVDTELQENCERAGNSFSDNIPEVQESCILLIWREYWLFDQ